LISEESLSLPGAPFVENAIAVISR
jgi:hypothetical protein